MPLTSPVYRAMEKVAASTSSDNTADYTSIRGFVCCAWMDLHTDVGSGVDDENPYFFIRPIWWEPGAVLLCWEDGGWRIVEPTGEIIQIRATNLHGLVPKKLAEEVVARNSTDFEEFHAWEDDASFVNRVHSKDRPVRMVWLWADPKTGFCYQKNSRTEKVKTEEDILRKISAIPR